VYEIPDKRIAINREIINDPEVIAELIPGMKPEDLKQLERKSIEVGNIFKLGTRFSSAFNSEFVAQDGQRQTPVMGCYGLGPTRLLGTMVEILHDENGLKWPTEVAPFKVHLVSLARTDAEVAEAEQIYDKLQLAGMEVLYDDRINAPAGEKFKDSDLLGMPYRVVVSQKTLAQGRLELKPRDSKEASMVTVDELLNMI
jgi:prolyl-tRNA synthetase